MVAQGGQDHVLSALTAAHFVFWLERALFYVQEKGDIGGPLVVALLCRMNTSVPKFERPSDSMSAGGTVLAGRLADSRFASPS